MTARQSGPHHWICGECEHTYHDATDDSPCPNCNATSNQWPAYNKARVTGDRYTPYSGHGTWGKMANEGMASDAQYNFQYRRNK